MSDTRTLQEHINHLLSTRFGINQCYPYQQLVIMNILEEDAPKNQLVILPTGYGKSLCFMVPGLIQDGITLIIYPLLSLMNDQLRRFKEIGANAVCLKGGQTAGHRKELYTRISDLKNAFILTTPETLQTKSVQSQLQQLSIVHIVVDEAHIVSTWGKTFRPAYGTLGTTLRGFSDVQLTAFTATATPDTIKDIRHLLFLDRPLHIIQGNIDRPNIFYRTLPTLAKIHDLYILLTQTHIQRPTLVFCGRRDITEHLAMTFRIRLHSQEIFYYHAGMSSTSRSYVENWFNSSTDGVLFATTAFGLGIDKADVRTVIHYQISQTVEAFLQESGRAGRDRRSALSLSLFYPQELQDPKMPPDLIRFLADQQTCRRVALFHTFKQEISSCFGCDVCNTCVIDLPDGEKEILDLIRHHPLQLSTSVAARILYGKASIEMRQKKLTTYWGFGMLSSWELDDIEQAIRTLIDNHRLYVKTHPTRAAVIYLPRQKRYHGQK